MSSFIIALSVVVHMSIFSEEKGLWTRTLIMGLVCMVRGTSGRHKKGRRWCRRVISDYVQRSILYGVREYLGYHGMR